MKEQQFWVLLAKKLSGEANTEEVALLQEYLIENGEWQITHDRLQELCSSKPEPFPETRNKEEDAYLNHINRLKAVVPDFETVVEYDDCLQMTTAVPFYRRWAKVGVSLAAVGILFYFLMNSSFKEEDVLAANKTLQNEVKVSLGSKSKIQLPDGTEVWINSGSKLTYSGSFKGSTREVVLDGEAYFDVVRDPAHPFIVHTSNIDIRVVGTAFNVKAYDADNTIEATLIHGSIEVVNRNQPDAPKVMLKPHEKIIFNKELHLLKEKAELAKSSAPEELLRNSTILITPLAKNIADSSISETSWVYNRIAFEDEKMTDVAKKLERWYNVNIEITDEKIRNIRVSGAFIDESIEEAMKDLQLLIPFKYQIINNSITINKK